MIRTINRVALYARFSSDNQRSESIDAQIRAMTAYCKQNNMVIVETYIDEARSATTDKRPSFQKMIADSSLHTFNILLVHKLDRFARNRYDSAVYKRELKKNGVTVYSVLENLDDSPESIMMESVLEGMSEYYSQNLAREVMKGMRETALQGKHTGGKPPLGFDVDPDTKKLVINEREAEAVRVIYDMFSKGYGYSAILDTLHTRNYKTKRGADFQKNSLHSILTNQKYQGMYIFNQSSAKSISGTRNNHLHKDDEDIITIEGGCPQLVDKETFRKVQDRIASNKHCGLRNAAKRNYLLSGKVFCKECGRAMAGNARVGGRDKQWYVTYRCLTNKYSCSNREINKEYLERYVIHLLEERIFNPTAMKRIAKAVEKRAKSGQNDAAERVKEIDNKLDEIEVSLKNVAEVVAKGLSSSALLEKLTELETEKAVLEAERDKLNAEGQSDKQVTVDPALIPAEYKRLKEATASPEYKTFIQGFIERIEVGRYSVDATIKTGLDIFPSLDTTVSVRREEVYKRENNQNSH